MNYFSADFHLGHSNVIRFDKRPYTDVQEMNEDILRIVETTLKKGDNFYYLGDFSFVKDPEEFMKRIAATGANLFFIKGNHDHKTTINLYAKYGTYLGEQKSITIDNQVIVLNHYRMDVWDRGHYGAWHLHGHSHHSLPERPQKVIDVGINGYYRLLEFSEIEQIMAKKENIKHHYENE